MESRVRMGYKPSAKGIVGIDVTVDCTLSGTETPKDVTTLLGEAIKEFKEEVVRQGHINATNE